MRASIAALAALVALAGPLGAAPLGAAPIGATPRAAVPLRAILARGPDAVRGLPFFSANAIRALRVEYALVPAARAPKDAASAIDPGRSDPVVRVWFTRERVVLGREWRQTTAGSSRAWLLARPPARDGASGETAGDATVLAILPGTYALFFELPDDSPRSLAFAPAFLRRFAVFLENARSDAELSMPAFVDLAD